LGLPHPLTILRWLLSKIEKPIVSLKPKEKYRLPNWPSYNAGLKQGGSLTLWLCEDVAQQGYHQGRGQKGGQFLYADACILLLLRLKVTFKLPFPPLAGFARSLMELLKLDLQVPDYSQICRRQKGLCVPLGLGKHLLSEPIHLVA
jgi:hypothetical protein